MSLIELFLKSALIAFSVAIPVGPMAMLCVKYTISNNYKGGIIAGFGIALADVICAGIAGFGVAIIANYIYEYEVILRFFAALLLIFLGVKDMVSPKIIPMNTSKRSFNLIIICWTTFFLTIVNPLTIALYLAVFPAFEIHSLETQGIISIIMGVLMGAMLWWNIFVSLVCYFKKKASLFVIKYAGLVTGFIITIFGLGILFDTLLNVL